MAVLDPERLQSWLSDLGEQYRKILEDRRESRSETLTPNLYPWHARIAVGVLLDVAISEAASGPVEICLSTGSACDVVYGGENFQKFQRFLACNGTLRCFLWSRDPGVFEHRLLSLQKRRDAKFRVVKPDLEQYQAHHFMVVGNGAYRFEMEPHSSFCEGENSDPWSFSPEVPAQICFNGVAIADPLRKLFQVYWDKFGESLGKLGSAQRPAWGNANDPGRISATS